ncbi:ubiquitin-protein ligase E3C [Verticillium alfalfae VaMs.102]|uniref:HECT-type E3 ubiquitin transferase n=1 Tax=Verticillium alfalfae (strain VaMs.102 / ATCC MYA-4576 / FGSC 10136) TaxID=526221 RepID=C9STA9_VERA1|nr:ubiquitin-protein ligase E3C [Verticillium alfalfae VaMs.102]EEY22024.1 ubiquitin-protein ligase E3C [Verticillium alfalfae VaMs.102]
MHSTFTGNSRRTRNVNLSGQNQNPFANVWSPSASSGASKTVSNAQAERQQRQLERDRLKAARNIQRTWRSHHVRRQCRDVWRQAFDDIYRVDNPNTAVQRVHAALPLLLAAFQSNRPEDVHRLAYIARDVMSQHVRSLVPASENQSSREQEDHRLRRLSEITVEALGATTMETFLQPESKLLVDLLAYLVAGQPQSVMQVLSQYFRLLATLVRASASDQQQLEKVLVLVLAPLNKPPQYVSAEDARPFTTRAYDAFAFDFLAVGDIAPLQQENNLIAQRIDIDKLSGAIIEAYSGPRAAAATPDSLLWLLAYYIDIHQTQKSTSHHLGSLHAMHLQLSSLASQIRFRLPLASNGTSRNTERANDGTESMLRPLPPYVSTKLTSCVDRAGITDILSDLARSVLVELTQRQRANCSSTFAPESNATSASPNNKSFQGASLLAGYIVTLLRCFPTFADDIRMRLFLGDIPSTGGNIPVIKYLWQTMSQTSLFERICHDKGSAHAVELGICPALLHQRDPSGSCSKASPHPTDWIHSLASLKGQKASNKGRRTSLGPNGLSFDKPDLAGLRAIVTSTLRMLYERDSRRPFLPRDHWLMTSKFDMEKFASSVVREHDRQQEELANLSEDEDQDEEDDMDDDVEMENGVHTFAGQRLSQHAQIENIRARQRRAQKARMLSVIGPKLEILRHMPFVIPFDARVHIFRQFIYLDQQKRRQGMDAEQWRMTMINNPLLPQRGLTGRHRGSIKRGQEFDDAFEQFYELGESLKEPVQIQFIDSFGDVEAGIDGGGVAKEFLLSAINQVFMNQSEDRYFVENNQKLWYPNPIIFDKFREEAEEMGLPEAEKKDILTGLSQRYEFLGRLVGKCMYEDILIDVNFAGFFLLKWAASGLTGEESYRGNVNDLRDLDASLYQGLVHLKNLPADEVESLSLDFTVDDQISADGETVRSLTRELIPGRGSTPVTKDNRLLYISYMARHRLVVQPAQQTMAFLRGLRAIVAPTWLSMFNQTELQRLVGGDSSEISIDDLRDNTNYSGLYVIGDDGEEHPTIQLFWKVVRGFTDAQRRDLLKYVTSTPRAPLLGFGSLNPLFSIRDGGTDEARLPSASTCVNLLKLPRYTDEETLRRKLVLAISSGAGFDLS